MYIYMNIFSLLYHIARLSVLYFVLLSSPLVQVLGGGREAGQGLDTDYTPARTGVQLPVQGRGHLGREGAERREEIWGVLGLPLIYWYSQSDWWRVGRGASPYCSRGGGGPPPGEGGVTYHPG